MEKRRYENCSRWVERKDVIIDAVQFDGNIRCLDVFPIHEIVSMDCITSLETGAIVKIDKEQTLHEGDFLVKENGGYKVYTEKDFYEKYTKSPNEFYNHLIQIITGLRKEISGIKKFLEIQDDFDMLEI